MMFKVLRILLLSIIFVIPNFGQNRGNTSKSPNDNLSHQKIPYPLRTTNDLRTMLLDHVLKKSFNYLDDANIRRERAFQQGKWESYGESIRQHVKKVFGEMPYGQKGGFLNTRLISTYETRHCRIENIIFESFPGWEVNASVFIPYGKGPFPAVVIPVGHSGKQFANYQIPAQAFAELGYVAVLFDPPGQSSEKQPGNDHFYDGVRTFLTGYSSQRYFVLDALRCIDYLETRDDVDMSNGVGMTGVSGGGYTTLFATMLDKRIACQGPSCCITSLINHPIGDVYAMCPESMWSGRIAAGVDEIDILLAAIPTPTIYMAGKKDEVFKIEWTKDMVKSISKYFSSAGFHDRFRFYEDEGGHAYTLEQVRQFVLWMNRWLLKNPNLSVPSLSYNDYSILDYEMIRCYPSAEENIYTLNRTIAHKLRLQRNPKPSRENIRQSVRNVIGTPTNVGRWEQSKPFQLWAQNYYEVLFTSEEFEIPATLLKPTEDNYSDDSKWIIYIDELGRQNALESWGPSTQLSQMFTMDAKVKHPTTLIPDLPGWGSSYPSIAPYSLASWGSMDRIISYISCALGDGVLAMQSRIAANTVQYLINEKNVKPENIILLGKGLGGVVVLLAGAAVQEVGAIICWSSLASFQSLVEAKTYSWPSAAFLPDALPHFDLPEIVSSITSYPVLILDPLNAVKHSLSKSEIDSIFSYSSNNVTIVPKCEPNEAIKRIKELINN